VEPDPTNFFSVAQGYGIEKLPSPDEAWDIRGAAQRTWNVLLAHGEELAGVRFTVLPYSSLVLLSATFATVPWIRWSKRFTLRTLLIATTLVAVILGAIVYAAK
jgi:hypothetical protein